MLFRKIHYRSDPIRCIGALKCGVKECNHYNKHKADIDRGIYAVRKWYRNRYKNFMDVCKWTYWCEEANGFVRCIHEDDFKFLASSDPNYAFTIDRGCPSFD